MKKIAFIIFNTKKSGGLNIILKLADCLKINNFDVKIYCISKNKSKMNLDVELENIFTLNWLFIKYDYVIATFWPTAFIAILMRAKDKLYFVQNWEEYFYNNILLALLVKLTIMLPLKIITVSSYLKIKIKSLSGKNSILVFTPVDYDVFSIVKEKKISNETRILSVVSSYGVYKGINDLIRLVTHYKSIYPSWKFVLISYEAYSPSDIFDEFISDPSRNTLIEEYHNADVLLHTSIVEGFPQPPLEAMCSGCPTVACDSGGLRAYAKDGYNAVVRNNIDDIIRSKSLEKVILDRKFRKKLSKNAIITAKKFNWNNTVNKFIHILDNK